ncbi:YibE/F family protein [uncultured Limosilactobacillus sp.]|uniref:YibE/F family protein n=1 Tax=uncultured Limosilactobacillus sp. TaxID=2837629 RepID=UPI0025FCE70D|nr:YibE/F family protein [uncultured Limosilactobacillus sp.]
MSSIVALSLALLVIMISVGRQQGWTAFVSIWLNFGAMVLLITLMAWHLPPLPLTIAFSVIILAITIFMGADNIQATLPAFYASLMTVAFTIILVIITTHLGMAYGFGFEDSDDLQGMSVAFGINYIQISIAITTLATLGAIAEAAIAISSGMQEVLEKHQDLGFAPLFNSGMHIGHQIIGTALNTLFFGFFGGLLSLFTWFAGLHYSPGMIINNQIMVGELLEILLSFVGVLITVPFTALITVFIHERQLKNNQGQNN